MNYEEKLQKMISEDCYYELVEKLKEQVVENNSKIMLPAIAKALVEGGIEERERILNYWLGMDSCRVCTTCGKIIEDGWYLNDAGYVCSDECAAKSKGLTMDEFNRYKVYKDDLIAYLKDEGKGRKLEDLSEEECAEIINEEIMENVDYYWTDRF